MSAFVIDLAPLQQAVFTGRTKGERLRNSLSLDALDVHQVPLRLAVPADTYAVTSGFFLGLLGPRIRRAKTPQTFFESVVIDGPAHVVDSCRRYVEDALRERL